MPDIEELLSPSTGLYVLAVVLGVVVAALLAPTVWTAIPNTDGENPTVTVVTLRGGTTDANVNAVTEDLREARTNASVEAVVLRIDSNGGPVDSSEEFYLAVNRTASEMPVVAYVEGSAASGGYFGIAPADSIYVKPSSSVGSIGVIVSAPLSAVEQVERQRETFVRSGPDKAQITKDGLREDIEALQAAFVGTIMQHRGDDLELSRSEVANGDVYLGTRAVENGFADEIGDLDAAIERAADLSENIEGDDYDVAYRERRQIPLELLLGADDVEKVEGNIIYVDRGDDRRTEFVQPVEYYAVWGVPSDYIEGNTTEEVTVDG
jgi:protease-4